MMVRIFRNKKKFFFRHNAITHFNSLQKLLYILRNQKIVLLVLLWWTGTKPTVSLRYACTHVAWIWKPYYLFLSGQTWKYVKILQNFWKVTSGNFEVKIWIWDPFFVGIDGITDLDFAKDDLTSGWKKSYRMASPARVKNSVSAWWKAILSGEQREIQQAMQGSVPFGLFCTYGNENEKPKNQMLIANLKDYSELLKIIIGHRCLICPTYSYINKEIKISIGDMKWMEDREAVEGGSALQWSQTSEEMAVDLIPWTLSQPRHESPNSEI